LLAQRNCQRKPNNSRPNNDYVPGFHNCIVKEQALGVRYFTAHGLAVNNMRGKTRSGSEPKAQSLKPT
jgi:hypothetical protein